jgi:hypothetical protein
MAAGAQVLRKRIQNPISGRIHEIETGDKTIEVSQNGGNKVEPERPTPLAMQSSFTILERRQTLIAIADEVGITTVFVAIAIGLSQAAGATHAPLWAILLAGGLGVLTGKPTKK